MGQGQTIQGNEIANEWRPEKLVVRTRLLISNQYVEGSISALTTSNTTVL